MFHNAKLTRAYFSIVSPRLRKREIHCTTDFDNCEIIVTDCLSAFTDPKRYLVNFAVVRFFK